MDFTLKKKTERNMAMNCIKEGNYLIGDPLSSTPIQSSEDSGYFGSDKKLDKNVFSACSPIEYSFKAKVSEKSCLEQVSNASQTFSIRSPKDRIEFSEYISLSESIEELDIPDISTFNQSTQRKSETISSPLLLSNSIHVNNLCSSDLLSQDSDIKYELFPKENKNSPPEKKELKISTRNPVDFLLRLKEINCQLIISKILSYLTEEELCKASCVSKTWKKAISKDKKANNKKKKFLSEKKCFLNGPSKENRLGTRFGPAREHKQAFSIITNTCITGLNEKTKLDFFVNEIEKGKRNLLKCPKCNFASKLLEKKTYICTDCCYKFCSFCYDPVVEVHACQRPQIPKTIIGSKRSKKNLKRL